MAFASNLRRFTITTGSVPTTNIRGVVAPDGKCWYQEYIGGNDKYGGQIQGKLSDLTEKYSGQTNYALTYTDPAAPTYTSVSPTGGSTSGGTAFTITGTNLNGTTVSVTIGGVAATGVTSNGTTIKGTSPAGGAGAKNIVITTEQGTVTGTGAWTYS